jgi:hypothetical protein
MPFESVAEACAAGFVIALLAAREVSRRLGLRYEYRWETFAVRSPGGRQLLHIRQSEIQSIEPLQLKDRIWRAGGFKRLSRTSLAPQVVIRSTVAHARPVVVSWEGRPIAGLQPQGCRLRPDETGRKG